MKQVTPFIAVLLLMLSAASCDFFRVIAGRPTSAELSEKRERIAAAEQQRLIREQERLDSIARADRYRADSLYALDTLSHAGKLRYVSSLKSLPGKLVEKRYSVVVGAFSSEDNARRLSGRYAAEGLTGGILRSRNGLHTVYVCPCDSITVAMDAYRRVRKLPFGSKETWILVNE